MLIVQQHNLCINVGPIYTVYIYIYTHTYTQTHTLWLIDNMHSIHLGKTELTLFGTKTTLTRINRLCLSDCLSDVLNIQE